MAYQEFLDKSQQQQSSASQTLPSSSIAAPTGHARLSGIRVCGVATAGGVVNLRSGLDSLVLEAAFIADPALPTPSLAVTLHGSDGRIVASAGAWNDGFRLQSDKQGKGHVRLEFPALPLLKGRYDISVHLFCERGLFVYDVAGQVVALEVSQTGIEQGLVHLEHSWTSQPGSASFFTR
jgi:lipopolysaccharide transport system ATP-binding protein